MRLTFIFLSFFLFTTTICQSQSDSLRKKIERILFKKKADVGVSILSLEDSDTLTVHGSRHYPMQSVYKFHLALAILHQVDKGVLSLSQKIFIKKSDLLPDTHSPLRDDHPQGNINMSLEEILRYTVSMSDNNGCDILFRLLGGTSIVNKYIHSLGIKDVSIAATEEEMHKEWNVQFTNWITPRAATQLAALYYNQNILTKENKDVLFKFMVESPTGPNRIKGLLPANTIVAHKTGTSDTNNEGVTAVIDDLGIIVLPNGKHIIIMVMVCNTKEDKETNERIIAEISKAAYDYFAR